MIVDLDFVGPNLGYLLDARGAIWKTTNGGGNWKSLSGVGSRAYQVEFSSPLNGYATVAGFGSIRAGGVVLRTTDGGRSWHPQLVSPFAVADIESVSLIDYLLAGQNAMYATAVGGTSEPDRADDRRASAFAEEAGPCGRERQARSGRRRRGDRRLALQNGRWTHRLVTAASNGTFATRWSLRRSGTSSRRCSVTPITVGRTRGRSRSRCDS